MLVNFQSKFSKHYVLKSQNSLLAHSYILQIKPGSICIFLINNVVNVAEQIIELTCLRNPLKSGSTVLGLGYLLTAIAVACQSPLIHNSNFHSAYSTILICK